MHAWLRYGDGSSIAAIVSDLHMPGVSGPAVLEVLRQRDRSLPFVLMSGQMTPQIEAQAHDLGATAVFDKPFCMNELRRTIRQSAATDSQ